MPARSKFLLPLAFAGGFSLLIYVPLLLDHFQIADVRLPKILALFHLAPVFAGTVLAELFPPLRQFVNEGSRGLPGGPLINLLIFVLMLPLGCLAAVAWQVVFRRFSTPAANVTVHP